jgi:hypothetical protein
MVMLANLDRHPSLKFTPCPNHRGINIANYPCGKCDPEGHAKAKLGDETIATVTDIAAAREPVQPTLSDALFPAVSAFDVPVVKLTVSGTIKLPVSEYQALLDGEIKPGSRVTLSASGYVIQPGPAWVKRTKTLPKQGTETWWENEGRVKIKLVNVGAVHVAGEWHDGE